MLKSNYYHYLDADYTAEATLKQIDDKGYLIPYQADGREVIKIGVEFSAEKRNISRWLV